jgi:hypothetical protein
MTISRQDMEMVVRSMSRALGLHMAGSLLLNAEREAFEARFQTTTPFVTTYLAQREFDGLLESHGGRVMAVDLDPGTMSVLREYVNASAARVRGASIRQWLLDDRAVRFDTAATDEEAFADFEAFERMSGVLMEHAATAEKRWKGRR